MPDLLTGNIDAFFILSITHRQVIVAPMGGIVDINHMAVWKAIEKYQISNELVTFEKVIQTFRTLIRD